MRPTCTSARGVRFIAGWEGLRLAPYNDAAGHATIGYGHLLHFGPVDAADMNRWATLTPAGALHLLAADLHVAEAAVRDYVKPPFLFPWRFDALVSFVFNVGAGAFEGSTVLERLCSGPARRGAADAMLQWDHAGGRVLAGLLRRRQAERSLFLYARY